MKLWLKEMLAIDLEKFYKLLEIRLKNHKKLIEVKKRRFKNMSEDDTYGDIWSDIGQVSLDCIEGIRRDYKKLQNNLLNN